MFNDDPILRKYLEEIREIPLLNKEEEVELGKRIAQGDSSAKKKLIESNLRLVVSVAKKYQCPNIQILDLIQVGNMGLIKAVERYDYTKDNRFSTYATWWIRQHILRHIYNFSSDIRVPVYLQTYYNKINDFILKYYIKNGQYPSDDSICSHIDVSKEFLSEIRGYFPGLVSMHTFVGVDEDMTLEEVVSDERSSNVISRKINQDSLAEEFERIFCILSEREQKVLRLRYGFDDNDPKTIEEVAKVFGLSKGGLRRIESEALKKLRKSSEIKRFQVFLDENSEPYVSPFDLKQSNYRYEELFKDDKSLRKDETIYEILSDYSADDIDNAISMLTDREQGLIFKRYNGNIKTSSVLPVTGDEISVFYNSILRRIEGFINGHKPRLTARDKIVLDHVNIDYYYAKLMSDYDLPSLRSIYKNVTRCDEVIIGLGLGLSGTKYSPLDISKIISVDEKRITLLLKDFLKLYRSKLVKIMVDSKEKNCVKNSNLRV